MDMRTPLGKVRGLGSAKDGTEHFWRQPHDGRRAMVPLLLFFVVFLIMYAGGPMKRCLLHLPIPSSR